MWMHNGAIQGFPELKRDLALVVDPSLYPFIEACRLWSIRECWGL
ncbi:hypothetical protein ACFQMG_32750 [Kitasatospora paranensis]|uniref:Glutamine amidotransferase type-2 domain-containing protein n=1 Tax=Kitasatospora paranensis TaxID=258053 RepID=A0ABW2G748_9ACTN